MTDRRKIEAIVNWIYKHNKIVSKKSHCPAYNLTCWEWENPLWKILKAPSEVILKIGGHCGNLARLTVNIFHFMGYKAYRWHLWNSDRNMKKWKKEGGVGNDPYSHAVVEVFIDKTKSFIVDPTFNVIYPYSMSYIKQHPDIIWKFVPKNYPWLYNYENPRGVRWHILGGKKIGDKIYNILCRIFGKNKVDNFHYPYIFENPYLFLFIFHFVISLILLLILIFIFYKFIFYKNKKYETD